MKKQDKPVIFEAVVEWFDELRGEGKVRSLKDGSTGWIYACNIKGRRTWFSETACVFYGQGEIVKVSQDEEGFVIGHTEGFFDAEKWARLNHGKGLAFVVDQESGKLKNGLFA